MARMTAPIWPTGVASSTRSAPATAAGSVAGFVDDAEFERALEIGRIAAQADDPLRPRRRP